MHFLITAAASSSSKTHSSVNIHFFSIFSFSSPQSSLERRRQQAKSFRTDIAWFCFVLLACLFLSTWTSEWTRLGTCLAEAHVKSQSTRVRIRISLTKSAQHCYVTTFAFPFPSSFPFPVVSFYFSLFLLLLLLVILPPSTSLAWPSLHKKNFCPSLTVSLVFSFSMQIKRARWLMMIDPALSFEALTHWNTKGRQAGKQTDSDLRDSRHAREDTQKKHRHTALLEEPRKTTFSTFFADKVDMRVLVKINGEGETGAELKRRDLSLCVPTVISKCTSPGILWLLPGGCRWTFFRPKYIQEGKSRTHRFYTKTGAHWLTMSSAVKEIFFLVSPDTVIDPQLGTGHCLCGRV